MLGRSGGALFSVLKRITGIDLLQDLSEFFQSFGDMAKGFSERAQRVNELLGHRDTTFVLVTAPEREPIDEAIYFWRRLNEAKLPFGGRGRQQGAPRLPPAGRRTARAWTPPTPSTELAGELERSLDGAGDGASLAAKVYENFERYRVLAAARPREHRRADEASSTRSAIIQVPYLDEDVHDIGGLARDQPLPVRLAARSGGRSWSASPSRKAEPRLGASFGSAEGCRARSDGCGEVLRVVVEAPVLRRLSAGLQPKPPTATCSSVSCSLSPVLPAAGRLARTGFARPATRCRTPSLLRSVFEATRR